MALSLPANFEKDIQSRDTALVPLVLIGSWDEPWNSENLIQISTNSIKLQHVIFKPLLLNIPALREIIDITSRAHKTSSVTLSVTNYKYEGVRFSELVGDKTLINQECRIWWASPSSTRRPNAADLQGVDDDSPLQIYNGIIRKYDITDGGGKLRL